MVYLVGPRREEHSLMKLILPELHIEDGKCVYPWDDVDGTADNLSEDPLVMARMWRLQNAKSIVIIDRNRTIDADDPINAPVISELCARLDIPIQVDCGANSQPVVSELIALGAYRVLLTLSGTPDGADNTDSICELLERVGSRKLSVRLPQLTDKNSSDLTNTISCLGAAKCSRVIVTAEDRLAQHPQSLPRILNLIRGIRAASSSRSLAITIENGVESFEDLAELESLSDFGVDSALVGRALYANRFPCQSFWIWNDPDSVDLDRFSSASMR